MEDSFLLKGYSLSPDFYDDFLQDDVLSSPLSYPQLNWDNDDFFDRKENIPEVSLNYNSNAITPHPTFLPLPIFEEQPSKETKPKFMQPLELPLKQRAKKKKIPKTVPFTQIFRPFENSLSTEFTVIALRNQIRGSSACIGTIPY